MRAKLGELLVTAGVVTPAQLQKALDKQQSLPTHPKLGEVLTALGYVTESALLEVLARALCIGAVDLTQVKPQKPALALVTEADAKRHMVLPLKIEVSKARKRLLMAMSDPTNVQAIDELQFKCGLVVQPVVCTTSQIRRAIQFYYEKGGEGALAPDDIGNVQHGADMRTALRDETWVGRAPTAVPVERRDIAELRFIKGGASGRVVRLKAGQSLVFGRGEQADICVPDMRMSRKHFVVVDSGTGVEIVDLGSRNGVSVNQRGVRRAVLKSEDYIEAGDSLIQVALLPRY